MYYINAKQQKKKEEIHFFYAFPQIFYKKFINLILYIVHKALRTLNLLHSSLFCRSTLYQNIFFRRKCFALSPRLRLSYCCRKTVPQPSHTLALSSALFLDMNSS